MEFSLRCNNHKPEYCRKQLQHQAVITSCSHTFCLDCIRAIGLQTQIRDRRKCPACGTALPGENDAVITELRPSEEYKNTALSGLDPRTILDCASRAISFWNYQMSTEIAWQQHLGKAASDKYAQLNNHTKNLVREANSQISDLSKEIEVLRLEKAEIQAKSDEMINLYKVKSKHFQELAGKHDHLRSRLQDGQGRDAIAISPVHTLPAVGSASRAETFAGMSYGRVAMRGENRDLKQQIPVDHNGVEQLHPFQRSGSALRGRGSSRDLVAQLMPPPPPPPPVLSMRRHAQRDSVHILGGNLTPAHRSTVTLDRASTHRGFNAFRHGSREKLRGDNPSLGLGVGLRERMEPSGPFQG